MKSKPVKFVLVHEEATLDALEPILAAHPMITHVYQTTGNYYTNGETGSEWFALHAHCTDGDYDEVVAFASEELRKLGGIVHEKTFFKDHG